MTDKPSRIVEKLSGLDLYVDYTATRGQVMRQRARDSEKEPKPAPVIVKAHSTGVPKPADKKPRRTSNAYNALAKELAYKRTFERMQAEDKNL